ncbi:MAG: pentapeptide repeat-containing protein, partial [Cyanobacteria bacterium J06649_4]
EYLKEKLFSSVSALDDLVPLFNRLKQFYEDWCEGIFIDGAPSENWPQIKMTQLKAAEIPLGLRQVDIYAGMNVLLLLFVLHGYGQQQVKKGGKSLLHFCPCGDPNLAEIERGKLLRMIGYSQFIRLDYFAIAVGFFLSKANLGRAYLGRAYLSRANLSEANLSRAYLSYADLSQANLSEADLSRAYLRYADLSRADLSEAKLHYANLSGADLRSANLSSADLEGIRFNEKTKWEGARGLGKAKNLPDVLKQWLGLT